MDKTIEYYNEHSKEFCSSTVHADMSDCRDKFTAYLPEKAHILDAGCGSGRDSKAFLDQGYSVIPMDASPKICEEATNFLHIPVLCKTFEEMTFEDEFDGIWACASLLHIPRENMDNIFSHLRKALKKNGVIYASFKYGNEERVVNGRLFNDYNESTLQALMDNVGFEIFDFFTTKDVREEHSNEKWINVIAGMVS